VPGCFLRFWERLNGYFVFLYPLNNIEWSSAIKGYMQFMQNSETSIFELHIEDFIKIMQKHVNEDWIEELHERYIKGL
jgi:hypothetical protein